MPTDFQTAYILAGLMFCLSLPLIILAVDWLVPGERYTPDGSHWPRVALPHKRPTLRLYQGHAFDLAPGPVTAAAEVSWPSTPTDTSFPDFREYFATRSALDFAADLTAGRPGASLGGTHYRLVERRRNPRG